MIIRYTFQHSKDKDYQHKDFTLDEIEEGKSKEYSYFMSKDGYSLVDRKLAENIISSL